MQAAASNLSQSVSQSKGPPSKIYDPSQSVSQGLAHKNQYSDTNAREETQTRKPVAAEPFGTTMTWTTEDFIHHGLHTQFDPTLIHQSERKDLHTSTVRAHRV